MCASVFSGVSIIHRCFIFVDRGTNNKKDGFKWEFSILTENRVRKKMEKFYLYIKIDIITQFT